MATGFYLLTFGVLLIYGFHRVTGWLHARGWIRWKVRRGTSSGLGNAVLGAQMILQPQIRDVLEVRLDERGETGESGDPPDPGAHDGRITSDEFYDEPSVHVVGSPRERRRGPPRAAIARRSASRIRRATFSPAPTAPARRCRHRRRHWTCP